jgi:site-specific DNA-methyltransferase (adenine-specific)
MIEVPLQGIDVIITSPPYDRGKTYQGDNGEIYNDKRSQVDYLSFLERVWDNCWYRASSRCVFFLNIGDSADDQGLSEKVAKSVENTGWIRIQDIIWIKSIYGKGHYTPSGGNKRLNNVWEHIFVFVKDKKEYYLNPKAIGIPFADKSNIGRYGDQDLRDAGNVWHICYEQTTGASVKKGHDAPFPIGLPYRCIQLVPYAEVVLDPFLGTGTTLAAAEALGKKGWGYEPYPKRQLIIDTIKEGSKYKPKPEILISDYEITIRTIVKLSKSMDFPEFTKKFETDYQIMQNTLKKMNLLS